MFNGMVAHNVSAFDEGQRLLGQLREIQHHYPDDISLNETVAAGLAEAVTGFAGRGQMNDAVQLTCELRELHQRFPASDAIAARTAQGISNAVGGYVKEATECLAGALNNAAEQTQPQDYAVSKLSQADRLIGELRGIQANGASSATTTQLARGISKAIIGHAALQDSTCVETFLNELAGLQRQLPEDCAVAGQVAWGIFHSIFLYFNLRNSSKAAELRTQLEQLEAKFPGLHMGDYSRPQLVDIGGALST
jgi:hypothetical protein